MLETAVSFGQLLWGTLVLRPYVFIFLSVYLCLATWHLGLGRTLIYLVCGYGVAWLSEVSSINTGFPYGFYIYIPATRAPGTLGPGGAFHGLTVVCLPLLRQLQFSSAAVGGSDWGQRGEAVAQVRKASLATVILAAVLFVTLDIIIDPLALRGYRWFLGQIYGYPEPGIYFGIPAEQLCRLVSGGNRYDCPVAAPGPLVTGGCLAGLGTVAVFRGGLSGGWSLFGRAAIQPGPDILHW